MAYRIHPGQMSSGAEFRDDGVLAWNALRFSDPEAERLRLGLLHEALVSRAAGALRYARYDAALADLAEAESLGPLGRKALLLRWLARHPRAAVIASRLR